MKLEFHRFPSMVGLVAACALSGGAQGSPPKDKMDDLLIIPR